MHLSKTVCIVTGGASGIGLAFVKKALASGAYVVIADVQSPKEHLENLRSVYVKTDVTRKDDILACFDAAEKKFGKSVNVLINNAGIGEAKQFFTNSTHDYWKKVIDIDLTAVIQGTGIAIDKWLKSKQQGVIINTASMGGLLEMPFNPIYCSAKHGVVGFSRSCGILKNYGIRVNCICPDFTDTPMVRDGMEHLKIFKDVVTSRIDDGHELISPDLVADGMIQMIEDETKSGAVMRVNFAKKCHYKEYGRGGN